MTVSYHFFYKICSIKFEFWVYMINGAGSGQVQQGPWHMAHT